MDGGSRTATRGALVGGCLSGGGLILRSGMRSWVRDRFVACGWDVLMIYEGGLSSSLQLVFVMVLVVNARWVIQNRESSY